MLDSETTWRIHDGVESALLIDGRDYYRAFYAAALGARKSILLLGWQFDSDVQLLRGDDLPPGTAPEDVTLLRFLDRLCRERPELEARVLAWDHSVVFALEREVLQKLYFDAITCSRFEFRWDSTVPLGGSHHQKVAIVDGRIAFFGSQDICQSRWDDSTHRVDNELRISRGDPHQPYHEVQVALTGAPVSSLIELFVARWYGATGERLDRTRLVDEGGEAMPGLEFPITLPIPAARMGLARTVPEVPGRAPVQEVGALYVRAIEGAERLIYIESQYLTSCVVRDALISRMRNSERAKLDIVVVLPHKPEKLKEEVTVGVPQTSLLRLLQQEAAQYGHRLGLYNVVAGAKDDGTPIYVYIHSKLMIVDDRYFIVGSANLTNRSMTIDSEIVAAYEARPHDRALVNALRRIRVRLLLEHTGERADVRTLVRPEGLVSRLDALAAEGTTRLRRHEVGDEEPNALVKTLHEVALEFLDPWSEQDETCPPAA
ncbi:MAG: phospholipase [Labilithrix sp.]|nr:phospholipase [Labilithrix sp.]MCW5816203.1 phospholipase [Labilithrix sp.]